MQRHKERPSAGYEIQALQISERIRARSLLEVLGESRTDIRQGVDPQLLERERSLQQKLNARAAQETRLMSLKDKKEEVAASRKEIATLSNEYQDIQTQIRQKSPRYAALTQPAPLKLSEIQQQILDRDTILLEYALGEKQSYLWAITKDSIKSYELPPRTEIETSARRIYALLSDGKLAIDDKAQAEYKEEAARLSQILLAPVAAQIPNKRIVVVADGALQYLPFGALPSPKTKDQPMIATSEIVSLPSASTLAVLRRETANRTLAAKSVAVFADPVFTISDARLMVKTNQTKTDEQSKMTLDNSQMTLQRALNLTGESNEPLSISRLPFTRREAEAILQFAPADSQLKALDFKASRETALSKDLNDYRIVHFATHGLLNSEHPELSGIVLSLVNEQGQTVDGFLRLNEIYNLNLSADLVVLSACQTALGKEIKGEGLIGLTRGFMYAGSPRVVASLWKVDDVATAELMKLFYKKMLQEKMRPAAALRAAKVEMRQQKRWNAPFYWAAFEIQGEWR
jgi:CHAT domain-containing protein